MLTNIQTVWKSDNFNSDVLIYLFFQSNLLKNLCSWNKWSQWKHSGGDSLTLLVFVSTAVPQGSQWSLAEQTQTRSTAQASDECKVLFSLQRPFPHRLSIHWRCYFLISVLLSSHLTAAPGRAGLNLIKRIRCSRLIMRHKDYSKYCFTAPTVKFSYYQTKT